MRDRALRWLAATALASLVAGLACEALTRPWLVSSDSYGYVDVARNIARGRGIAQSFVDVRTAGSPSWDPGPVPFTMQPPLYPLAIAGLIGLGMEPRRAALLVPLLALAALWWVAWLLVRRWWGRAEAAWALALLLTPALTPQIRYRAWSDPLAVALAALSLWLEAGSLECAARGARAALPGALGAGLAAGAAFATRYSFAMGAVVGLAPFLTRGRRGLPGACAFAAGFALVAAPVLARNLALAGSFLGSDHPRSAEPLPEVLRRSAALVLRGPAGAWSAALALLAAAALVALLRWRAGSWRAAGARFVAGDRWLVALWAVAYVAAIVAARTLVGFDDLGLRLLGPGLAFAALLLAVLAAGALPLSERALLILVAVVAAAGGVRVATRIASTSPVTLEQRIARSPRLAWVRDHVRPGDAIVGNATLDMTLYFRDRDGGPRRVAYISPAPYMESVGWSDVMACASRGVEAGGAGCAAYLILTREEAAPEEWRRRYGPFIADLALGRAAAHPGVLPVAALEDAWVFRLDPGAGGSHAPGQ